MFALKNQKARILALLLALVCMLSVTAVAADMRASDYIDKYDIDAVATGGGDIAIKISVDGTGKMTSLGAEEIVVYEKISGRWMVAGYYDKSDSGMVGTNTSAFSNTIYFSGYTDTEYKIEVTIFSEDATGSDSRYVEVYVNT